MKSRVFEEFEKEMEKRGLGVALVIGDSTLGNPELAYVTDTAIPRGGVFVKRKGRAPFLVVSNVDIASATRGRVKDIQTYSDLGYEKLIQRYGRERGYIIFIHILLQRARARGKIGVYTRNEFSRMLHVVHGLQRMGHNIAAEADASLLESLRETKDRSEIDKIRDVGARAARIISSIRELLAECTVSAGKVRLNRKRLTVGSIKRRINVMLAEQALMTPEGTVFAVGRSSADPHEMGNPLDAIRARAPIVFDLFPLASNGYWSDLTRTFVVGKAPRKIKEMYEAVLEVQLQSLDFLHEDASASDAMNCACDEFEERGYKTVRATLKGDKEALEVGFIHSLGHGVGLTIGERPYLSLFSNERLRAGHVLTVEPGLYDPRVGGVRIEDTVAVRGRGIENLTPSSKELEV